MKFAEIVSRSGRIPCGPIESRACPDQYVGYLSAFGRMHQASEWHSVQREPALSRPEGPALIVVLESPHIEEFEGDLGPAKNASGTGFALACWLRTVVGHEADDKDYSVILVNAVQYQCSLGCAPKAHRDEIFMAVWQDYGEIDFKERLTAIHRKGDIVLCCCTAGKTKPPLRELVLDAINDALNEAKVLRRRHPASWARNRNYREAADWERSKKRLPKKPICT
ncbi:hypothetical protein ACFJI0_17025 [Hydrogenophaga sp. UC242_53]|uniref:hypothetical protein n=1 Tax=Hydrogenophaga sp. UC242_53 TaxID=3350170 RepID=UPI0036D33619